MRQFIISEERLKMLLKHERELCYFKTYSMFCTPSKEDLEITEDDLKSYTEIKEHEYLPDINFDFNSTNDKKCVSVEIVRTVKFEPDFSDIDND